MPSHDTAFHYFTVSSEDKYQGLNILLCLRSSISCEPFRSLFVRRGRTRHPPPSTNDLTLLVQDKHTDKRYTVERNARKMCHRVTLFSYDQCHVHTCKLPKAEEEDLWCDIAAKRRAMCETATTTTVPVPQSFPGMCPKHSGSESSHMRVWMDHLMNTTNLSQLKWDLLDHPDKREQIIKSYQKGGYMFEKNTLKPPSVEPEVSKRRKGRKGRKHGQCAIM